MKHVKYYVRFRKRTRTVYAFSKHQAKILAQAEQIKAGEPYQDVVEIKEVKMK